MTIINGKKKIYNYWFKHTHKPGKRMTRTGNERIEHRVTNNHNTSESDARRKMAARSRKINRRRK